MDHCGSHGPLFLNTMERARRKEKADQAYELQVKSGTLVGLFTRKALIVSEGAFRAH